MKKNKWRKKETCTNFSGTDLAAAGGVRKERKIRRRRGGTREKLGADG